MAHEIDDSVGTKQELEMDNGKPVAADDEGDEKDDDPED